MLESLKGLMISRDIRSRTYYQPFYNASLTLLRNFNVVYIENSKVACTKIKKILLSLDNWPRTADDILEKEVHIHNKKFTGLIGPEELTYRGVHRVVSDPKFFRFAFVRNPYDRTLSAYVDKILAPQRDVTKRNYIPVAQKIKASFIGGEYKNINLDDNPVSFEEFVSYISRQKPYLMDRHWLHQHITLWHPHAKFDFLGRLENFTADFRFVLSSVGAPAELVDSVKEKANASKRTKKKYYTEAAADKVYRIFRKDFELYDYSRDSWVQY